MNTDTLIYAARLGEKRYADALRRFDAAVETEGALAATMRLGHDAVVAKATLEAMDKSEQTIRDSSPKAAILAFAAFAAFASSLAAGKSMHSDVLEQLYQDSIRRAYGRIADTLLPFLED